MTAPTCLRCGRPTADGYACTTCTSRATAQLAEIADMAPIAWDIAHGLSRPQSASGAAGAPGPRFPLDLASGAKLDGIANALGTWVRHICEERGVYPERVPPGLDVIPASARFLAGHLEWARHRPECDEFLADVEAAVRVLRSVTSGPAASKYLGPCGAVLECNPIRHANDCPEGCGITEPICEGDVYGRVGAGTGRCRTCGAEVSQAEREIWLDDVRRDWLYHASEISDAYPQINVNTIRTWIARGQLATHGEHDGRPLLKLGEVLDQAAEAAARRETARAERERRKTDREGATA